MRVGISDVSKKQLTVAEMPFARVIVKDMKDDETPIEEYCQSAMRAIAPNVYCDWKFFDVKADICRDESTPYDYFGEGAGRLNVWLELVAFDEIEGCYKVGCLLSHIFGMSCDLDETYEMVRNHAYIRKYKEVK